MRQFLRNTLLGCSVVCFSLVTWGQLGSATISTDKCSHIQSNLNGNQNNNEFSVGTYWSTRGQFYQRAFIEFDVSSIPSNAIVYEATINITHDGTPYVFNPWVTKLITSSWTETGVTPSNQPTISSSSSDWSSLYSNDLNTIKLDVKETVQRMIYGQIANYGWSIQVSNEAASYTSGTDFYSDENGSGQPELEVKYYLPVALSVVDVTHESEDGASDGGVSFSHTPIDAAGHTYNWYNSSGGLISTSTTSEDLTGVSYGWYGLEIVGNSNNEKVYLAFIVGLQCKEVAIEFAPDDKYIDNALSSNLLQNGIDFSDWNGGDSPNFQTSREQAGGVNYSTNSHMKFRLWIPDEVMVNKADLTLGGIDHVGANAASLKKVTSYWDEMLISWNNQPTSTSSISESLPMSLFATDATIDMTTFWNDWKQNNGANHGLLFELSSYGTPTKKQHYHSPTALNVSDRPKIDFKIALWEEECIVQYAHLDYEMDGYYHIMKGGKIRFVYDQQYDADILEFNIYDYHDDIVKTQSDFSAVNTTHGDNYITLNVDNQNDCLGRGFFYLEVITSKKEKLYMRFFNDFSTAGCTDIHADPGSQSQ